MVPFLVLTRAYRPVELSEPLGILFPRLICTLTTLVLVCGANHSARDLENVTR